MRRPRIDLPGLPLHVTHRGVNRADVFFCEGDRQEYLHALAYALETGGYSRSPVSCLRLDGPPVVVDVGLIHKSSLHMNALEIFKALCLDLRGPKPLELLLDRPNGSPFLRAATSSVSSQNA